MAEPQPIRAASEDELASVRLGRLAERQWGVASLAQITECGFGSSRVARLVRQGWLFPLHPGVYAIGRRSVSIEGGLVAAVLYAGPRAALSHTTAGWWWGLLPESHGGSTSARSNGVALPLRSPFTIRGGCRGHVISGCL